MSTDDPHFSIEIGGGTISGLRSQNLDPRTGEGDWKREAQDTPWPCKDNSAIRINASHVLEHIPKGPPMIRVWNECHRVLHKNGFFTVRVPLHPYWQAIADPDHVSLWVRESFHYFTGHLAAFADYGISPWREVSWSTNDEGWEGIWVGQPVK